jgi:hypothetical protein
MSYPVDDDEHHHNHHHQQQQQIRYPKSISMSTSSTFSSNQFGEKKEDQLSVSSPKRHRNVTVVILT